MSRFAVATALVLSLFSSVASVAHADQLYVPNQAPHFARAPQMTEQELPPDLSPARTLDRDSVRAALVARRATNLASFRAYQKAGTFPSNTYEDRVLNVWRDEAGHLCAAATIIDKDGKHDLVRDTAEKTNNLRLLDVTEGPLLDWMLTSGFTIEEIDRIQAPMVYPDDSFDPAWRTAEDARLKALYAETDTWLVKHASAGLDSAVKRLMAHPDLARRLVDAKI